MKAKLAAIAAILVVCAFVLSACTPVAPTQAPQDTPGPLCN